MDINRMRLGLVYIFSENNKLGKESKMQLINFIESATEHQLKALALDGTIMPADQLDEQACSIIDDRFIAALHIKEAINKASLAGIKTVAKKKLLDEAYADPRDVWEVVTVSLDVYEAQKKQLQSKCPSRMKLKAADRAKAVLCRTQANIKALEITLKAINKYDCKKNFKERMPGDTADAKKCDQLKQEVIDDIQGMLASAKKKLAKYQSISK